MFLLSVFLGSAITSRNFCAQSTDLLRKILAASPLLSPGTLMVFAQIPPTGLFFATFMIFFSVYTNPSTALWMAYYFRRNFLGKGPPPSTPIGLLNSKFSRASSPIKFISFLRMSLPGVLVFPSFFSHSDWVYKGSTVLG